MNRTRYLILVCPDPQLVKAHVDQRLAASGRDGWEIKPFWGDDDDPLPAAFWTDLTIKSLFPQPKALVIRRAHALRAEHWDKLDAAVRGVPADILPVFCLEGEWKGKKPSIPAALSRRAIFKRARDEGWVWESAGLDQSSLGEFVRTWARERSISFEPGADRALIAALPPDAVAARLELDKLELAAGNGRTVRREHVELVAPAGEMEFFELMDALGRPGAEVAVWRRVLGDHLKKSQDRMLFNLIGYLAGQARMYWMLQAGEEDKVKAHPYVKKLKTQVARRLGPKGVARMIDLALESELSVKTGARHHEEVLDVLVAGLIDLFRPDRTAR
ncbi:DNA polymerase III subunit delta [Pseudodesulfovibrio sp. F-1]|uniref:DNA polymerase III subunit delta n=1 Tax=Pseudodesulfovibrio alkaliphilus TaxID=2661613 RepID=A0A7K1KKI0_9BACT|nr:DNA polymerase III subunit delta [Pseudodesulfovibrio alkaliphilus]MUM76593.1 DNA polymerase III subunit delta [Pseudodesulfovibrio alkaliphilus]